mgnify:FL=1
MEFEKIAPIMYRLFVNRSDVYAIQTHNGYSTVNEPISNNQILEHLKGNETIGVYQLNKENYVKWCVFDFDKNTQENFEDAKK